MLSAPPRTYPVPAQAHSFPRVVLPADASSLPADASPTPFRPGPQASEKPCKHSSRRFPPHGACPESEKLRLVAGVLPLSLTSPFAFARHRHTSLASVPPF